MRREEYDCLFGISRKVARYMDEEFITPNEFDWAYIISITNQLHRDITLSMGSAADSAMLYQFRFIELFQEEDPTRMLYPISQAIDYVHKHKGKVAFGTLDLSKSGVWVWTDSKFAWCIRDISTEEDGQQFSAMHNTNEYYASSIDDMIIELYALHGETVNKVIVNHL